jgi:hypothetical protein
LVRDRRLPGPPRSILAAALAALAAFATMTKTVPPLAAALLLIAAAAGASAQNVYKWRDASGVMHISDTPPPPGVAQAVTQNAVPGAGAVVEPAARPASAASAAIGGDSELQRRKAQAEAAKASAAAAEKARIDKQNAAVRASNCSVAQEQSRVMSSGQRVATINAKGEREYLDDAAIAARQKQAQQAIADNCGK